MSHVSNQSKKVQFLGAGQSVVWPRVRQVGQLCLPGSTGFCLHRKRSSYVAVANS